MISKKTLTLSLGSLVILLQVSCRTQHIFELYGEPYLFESYVPEYSKKDALMIQRIHDEAAYMIYEVSYISQIGYQTMTKKACIARDAQWDTTFQACERATAWGQLRHKIEIESGMLSPVPQHSEVISYRFYNAQGELLNTQKDYENSVTSIDDDFQFGYLKEDDDYTQLCEQFEAWQSIKDLRARWDAQALKWHDKVNREAETP